MATDYSSTDPTAADQRPLRLVLSIDGGGVRGLLPAMLLDWLEKEIEAEFSRNTPPDAPKADIRLGEVFDLRAGTSTGGLISIGLGVPDEAKRPLYSLNTFVELYRSKAQEIFPSQSGLSGLFSAKYSPHALDKILKTIFKDFTLKDLLKPTLITAYDIHKEGLFVFNSQESHHEPHKNYPLLKVARATSAAPTYLPSVDVQEAGGQIHTLVDGGIAANNPSVLAYLEAQKLYPQDRVCVISLGCGASPIFTLESKKNKGKLHWAGDIASVLMNTTSNSTHHLMDQLTKFRGDTYIRIQFDLDQKANGLDNATPDNIKVLEGYAKREISNPHSRIHEIKNYLINFYKNKSFYVYFPLIQKVETQVSLHPTTLDLSGISLNERALWEITQSLKGQDRYLTLTHLILDKSPILSSWFSYLAPLQKLVHLSLKQIDGKEPLHESLKALNTLRHSILTSLISLDLRDNPTLQSLRGDHLAFFLKSYQTVELDPKVCGILGEYYTSQHENQKAIAYYRQGKSDKANQQALSSLLLATRDNDEAFEEGFLLCQSLADQGETEAQYLLGHLYAYLEAPIKIYLLQKGLVKDQNDLLSLKAEADQKAGYYYCLAAYKNHKKAALALGTLYREHRLKAPVPGPNQGEKSQLQEAVRYYRIAAEAGSESAKNQLKEVQKELENYLE